MAILIVFAYYEPLEILSILRITRTGLSLDDSIGTRGKNLPVALFSCDSLTSGDVHHKDFLMSLCKV